MRFVAAVVIGGLVSGLLMPQMWASEWLSSTPALSWIALLGIVPLAVGAVARDRGWAAAAAASLLGLVLWVGLYLRPSPPWAPSDNWSVQTWGMFVVTWLPWVIVAAVLGAIGGWTSRSILSWRMTQRQRRAHSPRG